MVRRLVTATAGAAWLTLVAGTSVAVWAAQHEGHQPPAAQPAALASECANAHETVMRLVETAKLRLESARQANSAAAFRDAADDVQGMLVDISARLAPCAAAPAPPAHVH